MVLAGKIFRLKEKTSLKDLTDKLKNLRIDETYTENNFQFTLTTEVKELNYRKGLIEGFILKDEVIRLRQKNQIKSIPKTVEVFFAFHEYKNLILLTILENKRKANSLANFFSEKVFGFTDFILEVKIPHEKLKMYHEQTTEETKVIFFSNVNIPNVKKLSPYGANIKNSALYTEPSFSWEYLVYGCNL